VRWLDYKIGQRVIALDPRGEVSRCINKEFGTVIGYGPGDATVAVQFDRFVRGHDCCNMGKYGYCWYVPRSNLSPISLKPNSTIKSLI
jgi:hypothetical protein